MGDIPNGFPADAALNLTVIRAEIRSNLFLPVFERTFRLIFSNQIEFFRKILLNFKNPKTVWQTFSGLTQYPAPSGNAAQDPGQGQIHR
jgi:hypothetical protein